MDVPQDFRCPISMELMKDPVTISTGVTYERKNIEKWFYSYKKNVCPATMQQIDGFDVTPNHTLKNLISAWRESRDARNPCFRPPVSEKHDELVAILGMIESTPFKVSLLRKLGDVVRTGDEIKEDFKRSGGVDVLLKIIVQVSIECSDFEAFRACEEALRILQQIPFSDEDERILQLLMEPDSVKSLSIMLQRGGEEARFCTVSTFHKLLKADNLQWNSVVEELGVDFFKSLLEILSDENCSKASSCALQVLIEILNASKKSRLKSVEAGAICTLIELLPDSNKSRCEKILQLIKLMCECADGRLAFVEHGLGIAAVSKKLLNVSSVATKIGVKILALISGFHTSERVLDEMMVCGAVKKLVALLQIGGGGGVGQSGTKEKVVRILKFHGGTWRRYPCFPSDLRNYLVSRE